MFNNIKLLLVVLLFANFANSSTLIKQGDISVTSEDIDAFAFTIPPNDRKGYFTSIERLDHTLQNILNMFHVVNYAKKNLKLDYSVINNKAKLRAENKFKQVYGNSFSALDETKYKQIEEYYKNQEIVGLVIESVKSKIKDNDLLDIAKEDYNINLSQYSTPKSYNFKLIGLNFTSLNKQEKEKRAKQILNLLKSKKLTFKDILTNASDTYKDINIKKHIDNFRYNETNKILSDILSEHNSIGLIPEVYNIEEKRFVIINITKINPEKPIPFENVKNKILAKYRQIKLEKDYNSLIISITQDPIEVNEAAIASIRDRYSKIN